MNKFKEKELKKFVIADLSNPTNYVMSKRNGMYYFIDNIVRATKFVNKSIAQVICKECIRKYNIDLVVIPILITYEIIEEDYDGLD